MDYRGLVLAEAGYGESMAACSDINIAALRLYRRRPGMGDLLSRQPLDLWRTALEGRHVQPRNGLLDAGGKPTSPTREFYSQRQRQVLDRRVDAGII